MIEQSQAPKYGKLTRPKNETVREREHLRPDEMESLIKAAGSVGRYGHRDSTLLLMIYRHGLRVSEAIALQWQQVDFRSSHIYRTHLGSDALDKRFNINRMKQRLTFAIA